MRGAPLAQFVVQSFEVMQSLFDLIEQVRARAALVLIAQFQQHLADAPDRPHRVVGVILTHWMHESGRESRFIIPWHAVWPFC